jgi:hypothetical protein
VSGVLPVRAPVGVEKTFRAYDPEQVLLMAPVLSEWVPVSRFTKSGRAVIFGFLT